MPKAFKRNTIKSKSPATFDSLNKSDTVTIKGRKRTYIVSGLFSSSRIQGQSEEGDIVCIDMLNLRKQYVFLMIFQNIWIMTFIR